MILATIQWGLECIFTEMGDAVIFAKDFMLTKDWLFWKYVANFNKDENWNKPQNYDIYTKLLSDAAIKKSVFFVKDADKSWILLRWVEYFHYLEIELPAWSKYIEIMEWAEYHFGRVIKIIPQQVAVNISYCIVYAWSHIQHIWNKSGDKSTFDFDCIALIDSWRIISPQ